MNVSEIIDPSFLKELNQKQLEELASDIRQFLITNIAKTGGHLSSNLGIVELTIALHYVFNSPIDKIFFDVGHQSYVHKILTGRATQFSTLRKTGGMSGFQKFCESKHDAWEAGHSSTALSAAVAMALSRDLDAHDYEVIPVIGDAAMVGGESLEALNHLGSTNSKVIVILNDNQMAIGKSVGGFGNLFSEIRLSRTYHNLKEDYRILLSKGKIRKGIFTITKKVKDFVKSGVVKDPIGLGVEYLGPVNGHDLHDLVRALEVAKAAKESVIIHVVTKKGKGYPYAENDINGTWHGIGPFDVATGSAICKQKDGYISWSEFLTKHLEKHMQEDLDIVAITPAMVHGSCMEKIFKKYPTRCFDVGIAEQHALTFTAGMSLNGKKPFISVYSSFLQRAYDQINHDIARMDVPCVIAIDRSGIVGADGPTHHGVFDIGFLYPIPNLIIFAPKDTREAAIYLNTAFRRHDHPYVIRVPRSDVLDCEVNLSDTIEIGTWTIAQDPPKYDITIICYGDNVNKVISLFTSYTINVRVINARFIKPMDFSMLDDLVIDDAPLVVYETDLKANSLASNIAYYYMQKGCSKKLYSFGIEDHYSMQGTITDILKQEGIDEDSLLAKVEEILHG